MFFFLTEPMGSGRLGSQKPLRNLLSQTRTQQQEKDIWLLFSPIKPKRQEFLVEKATELGAFCLWPIQCQRTSQLKVNAEKTMAHIIEAAEQSERLTIPLLKPLISLSDLLKTWPEERILLFGDETFNSPSLATFEFDPTQSYGFLVGPEGGFTPEELALLKAHPKARGVTLNPHILRAETAALVGISYLQLKVEC
jgi:16S rRNA (uracil1498-N3)-methyltransferase